MRAAVVIGGGVWFAVGRGSDGGSDDAKSLTSVGTPGATGSDGSTGEAPDPTDPTTAPSDEPSVSSPARSDNPLVPQPTGTGLQAVWKMPDSTMLGLGGAYTDEPARINAILSIRDGLQGKGRWQEDESGDFLEMALLCEQDGVRVACKDRVGNLRQNGDTLTVTWKKGATGTDTFERFSDMTPTDVGTGPGRGAAEASGPAPLRPEPHRHPRGVQHADRLPDGRGQPARRDQVLVALQQLRPVERPPGVDVGEVDGPPEERGVQGPTGGQEVLQRGGLGDRVTGPEHDPSVPHADRASGARSCT
ncbi:hypothetical protein SBADM41S_07570 [Streptomyces badius]